MPHSIIYNHEPTLICYFLDWKMLSMTWHKATTMENVEELKHTRSVSYNVEKAKEC